MAGTSMQSAHADDKIAVAMAETLKCPDCGSEVEYSARTCTKCNVYIRSELEILRDIDTSLKALNILKEIDASLKTIKSIAIWWLILSILAVAVVFLRKVS